MFVYTNKKLCFLYQSRVLLYSITTHKTLCKKGINFSVVMIGAAVVDVCVVMCEENSCMMLGSTDTESKYYSCQSPALSLTRCLHSTTVILHVVTCPNQCLLCVMRLNFIGLKLPPGHILVPPQPTALQWTLAAHAHRACWSRACT